MKASSMFIRKKKLPGPNFRVAVQLVKSVRVGIKVKQKILYHTGVAHSGEELENLVALTEKVKQQKQDEVSPSLFSPSELAALTKKTVIPKKWKGALGSNVLLRANANPENFQVSLLDLAEEARVIEGIHDVYGAFFDRLGFQNIFPVRKKAAGKMFKEMVMARLAKPLSKLASTELLQRDFGKNFGVDSVYRMMKDMDEAIIGKIKKTALHAGVKLLPEEKIHVVLFDVTTLYFECFEEDDLRRNGISKDRKPQILLVLLVTPEGLPLSYEVLLGDTLEREPMLETLRKNYPIGKAVFVADTGLISEGTITKLTAAQCTYILGARIKNQKKEITEQILNLEEYRPMPQVQDADEEDDLRIKVIPHPQGRLIVTYSGKRARKDKHDREKMLEKLKGKLEKAAQKNTGKTKGKAGYAPTGSPETYLINVTKGGKGTITPAAPQAGQTPAKTVAAAISFPKISVMAGNVGESILGSGQAQAGPAEEPGKAGQASVVEQHVLIPENPEAKVTDATPAGTTSTAPVTEFVLNSFYRRFLTISPGDKTGKTDTEKQDTPRVTAGKTKHAEKQETIRVTINAEKIKEEEKWDGLKGIISNESDFTEEQILKEYHQLYMVEDAFRITKGDMDLRIRPVYCHLPERVKAHVAICFTSLVLLSHLKHRLKLANMPLSANRIREELLHTQASIYLNKKTQIRYKMSSLVSDTAKTIYGAVGLKKDTTAKIISLPSKHPSGHK